MQVIPAVDLREGACVQLVGGSYANERIRLEDPVAVARRWERDGFRRLHLVDLDAATARGSNRELVREILSATSMTVQCGGGIRELDDIDDLLQLGASAVVLGTKAIEDPHWLETAAERFPGSLIVAADVKERRLVTHGWSRMTSKLITSFIDDMKVLPLAGLLVTAVHREGLMQGPDLRLMTEIMDIAEMPVQASGGIANPANLRDLADAGVSAAIVGMALYTGALNAQNIIEEFAQ